MICRRIRTGEDRGIGSLEILGDARIAWLRSYPRVFNSGVSSCSNVLHDWLASTAAVSAISVRTVGIVALFIIVLLGGGAGYWTTIARARSCSARIGRRCIRRTSMDITFPRACNGSAASSTQYADGLGVEGLSSIVHEWVSRMTIRASNATRRAMGVV
jgi:hypothetical protein